METGFIRVGPTRSQIYAANLRKKVPPGKSSEQSSGKASTVVRLAANAYYCAQLFQLTRKEYSSYDKPTQAPHRQ